MWQRRHCQPVLFTDESRFCFDFHDNGSLEDVCRGNEDNAALSAWFLNVIVLEMGSVMEGRICFVALSGCDTVC